MAYQPIVLGSNLIPDGALGALPGGDYSSPDEDRTAVVTNEDGTDNCSNISVAIKHTDI